MLIQRRTSVDNDRFNRPFADFVNGFSTTQGDFWFGLELLHKLTSAAKTRYQLVLGAKRRDNGRWMEVVLDNFYVDSGDGYHLRFGSIVAKRNTGISDWNVNYFRDKLFSARDRDQDTYSGYDCASSRKGGWWFGYCSLICLNCDQRTTSVKMWYESGNVPLTETKMSIRIKM